MRLEGLRANYSDLKGLKSCSTGVCLDEFVLLVAATERQKETLACRNLILALYLSLMASGKPNKALKQKPPRKGFGSKSLSRNPKTPIFKNPNHIPLGKNNRAKTNKEKVKSGAEPVRKSRPLLPLNATASQQLHFFLDRFQSANGIQLSSLELEGFKGTYYIHTYTYVF